MANPSGGASSPSGSDWPAAVVGTDEALAVLTGGRESPEELSDSLRRLLKALSFVERSALHPPPHSREEDLLCRMVAVRWRVQLALESRPAGGVPGNPEALDQLVGEVDDVLAFLGELSLSADAELKGAAERARADFARAVQRLLHVEITDEPGVAEQRAVRRTLAEAESDLGAPSAMRFPEKGSRRSRWLPLAVGGAAISVVAMGATIWMYLWVPAPRPIPTLPPLPANAVLLGDLRRGSVIVQSASAAPLDAEEVRRFSAQASASGITVQPLGPRQLFLSAGSR